MCVDLDGLDVVLIATRVDIVCYMRSVTLSARTKNGEEEIDSTGFSLCGFGVFWGLVMQRQCNGVERGRSSVVQRRAWERVG